MKKSKLSFNLDYDFDLLGLVSSVKGYKLAWVLNHALHIRFVKEKDINIEFLANKNIIISNFIFRTTYITLRLLKNRSEDNNPQGMVYLLPELKEFDYLLMVQDQGDTFFFQNIVARLRSLNVIQFISKIEIANLKSKENLIF